MAASAYSSALVSSNMLSVMHSSSSSVFGMSVTCWVNAAETFASQPVPVPQADRVTALATAIEAIAMVFFMSLLRW